MRVFKFGGASIKNAESIKGIAGIIQNGRKKDLVVVVSAMGKTTNALEEIVERGFNNLDFAEKLQEIRTYHAAILDELIPKKDHPVFAQVEKLFNEVKSAAESPDYKFDYDLYYDQIVSKGELISSSIVAHYLNYAGVGCIWFDAREAIKTDDAYREAKVDWDFTRSLINRFVPSMTENSVALTQGFIGSSLTNMTTTLGREGSDFTAAIFASCLKAESVTIWKDVPGVLNADPKLIKNTVKFKELSYNEAAEMTYYGAQVIHPKTIKPLANAGIPLYVKSFEKPNEEGTLIHDCTMESLPPAIIFKFNQCIVSFHVKDLTFIDEKNLSIIFHVLDKLNIRINVMQNSAVSFSICIDNHQKKLEALLDTLKNDFDIKYNQSLTLITIKNYDQATIDQLSDGRNILLEQRTRQTFQIVADA